MRAHHITPLGETSVEEHQWLRLAEVETMQFRMTGYESLLGLSLGIMTYVSTSPGFSQPGSRMGTFRLPDISAALGRQLKQVPL